MTNPRRPLRHAPSINKPSIKSKVVALTASFGRHCGAGLNPVFEATWTPACAGVTELFSESMNNNTGDPDESGSNRQCDGKT
jgi:hypothetical protein